MGLPWSPRGAQGDLCAGVDVYNAARDPLAQQVLVVDAVVTALFFAVLLGFGLAVFALKDSWFIANRNLIVVYGNLFVFSLFFVVTPIKKLVYPNMPCVLHGVIWLMLPPMQASLTSVRLIYILNAGRYAKRAQQVRQIFNYRHSDLGSEVSSSVASEPHLQRSSAFSKATTSLFEIVRRTVLPMRSNYSTDDCEDTESNYAGDRQHMSELIVARDTLKNLHRVLLLFLLPPMAVSIAFVLSLDVYRGNCLGCDLWAEVVITGLIMYFVMLMIRLRIAHLCSREDGPDPLNLIPELRIQALFFVPCLLGTIIMLIADPLGLDYENQLQWEWILLVGVGIVTVIEVVLPVLRALRDRKERSQHEAERRSVKSMASSSTNVKKTDLINILANNPSTMKRFQDYCQSFFCVESARFLADVLYFKDFFTKHRTESASAKAKAIFNLYIADDAPLRINLPSHVYSSITECLASGKISIDTFDEALNEIVTLLKWPLWHTFVLQGGLNDKYGHRSNAAHFVTPSGSVSASAPPSPRVSAAPSPRESGDQIVVKFSL